MKLSSEDYAGAYRLSQDALAMEDRLTNLIAEAGKLALSNKVSKVNKSEIKDFCYRKLKIMEQRKVSLADFLAGTECRYESIRKPIYCRCLFRY